MRKYFRKLMTFNLIWSVIYFSIIIVLLHNKLKIDNFFHEESFSLLPKFASILDLAGRDLSFNYSNKIIKFTIN